MWRVTWTSLILLLAVHASGEKPCTNCGQPAFPEASAFLATLGYPAEQFTVLMAWRETAPADRRQEFGGYHIRPKDGPSTFDVYVDAQGIVVEPQRLPALGIKPKNWDLKPRETRMKAASGRSKNLVMPVLNVVPPTATVSLPPLDRAAVAEEDAAAASTSRKDLTRFGVFQNLEPIIQLTERDASTGAWQMQPDGSRIWSAEVYSAAARGLRLHFADIVLPAGTEVAVYNAADSSEAYGPYTGPNTGNTDLWAASCFGERVVVQCRVPSDAQAKELKLTIDKLIYIYRGFDTLPWAKSAGACNLDVTCYPAWADAARGVGGIGSIDNTGFVWCTGSLLVDTDSSTDIPYFLTAYHCVNKQDGYRGASTIEVYWMYQTDECNGTPPAAASVPRTTGGADFLSGSIGDAYDGGGNDFSLLRLRNAPPSGVNYLGWSTIAQPIGTDVVCIHHANSDFKRISFGALNSTEVHQQPTLYHQVFYSEGTTEPGSSGCPLMLAATGQVIGQLWGGTASCLMIDYPDYYGRFDVTFPIIQSYLAPEAVVPNADFSSAQYSVARTDSSVTIEVILDLPPGATPAIVSYATSDGTALAGRDYQSVSGTLTFDGTLRSRTFTIPICGDTHVAPDRTLSLALNDPSNCAVATNGNNPATLTLLGNPDSDNDGLSDYDETHGFYGFITDPLSADTDGDGYTDYDEEMGAIPGVWYGLKSDPTEITTLTAFSVPFFNPQG